MLRLNGGPFDGMGTARVNQSPLNILLAQRPNLLAGNDYLENQSVAALRKAF
jgi:hypothetical protein